MAPLGFEDLFPIQPAFFNDKRFLGSGRMIWPRAVFMGTGTGKRPPACPVAQLVMNWFLKGQNHLSELNWMNWSVPTLMPWPRSVVHWYWK